MIGIIRDRAARALYALGGKLGGYVEEGEEFTFDADEADMTAEEISALHIENGWQYGPLGAAPDAEQVNEIEIAAIDHMLDNPDEGSYAVGRIIALRHKEMPNTILLTLWVASVDLNEYDEDVNADQWEDSE